MQITPQSHQDRSLKCNDTDRSRVRDLVIGLLDERLGCGLPAIARHQVAIGHKTFFKKTNSIFIFISFLVIRALLYPSLLGIT